MIKLKQPVIVEGKYDKIALENLLDTLIITTNGFGIFKDKEKQVLIRTLAQKYGVIVMTDSDSAGQFLRRRIKGFLPENSIINVYVPKILGKERRKAAPSKEGVLGVEGLNKEILLSALEKAGITGDGVATKAAGITKADFFAAGLTGKPDSANRRKLICQKCGIPDILSCNALLSFINHCYTRQEALKIIE